MTQPGPSNQTATSRPAATGGATTRSLFPVDSDTHLLDRLNAIYKYRLVVVTVFTLVIIGVIIRTYTTTPMYRATTTVLVEDERGASVAGFNAQTGSEYSQDPEPYFQTQLRILAGPRACGQSRRSPSSRDRAGVQRPGAAADRTGGRPEHDERAGAGHGEKLTGGGARASPKRPASRRETNSPAGFSAAFNLTRCAAAAW